MRKMILILLFLSDIWLGIVHLKHEKYLRRINACRVASKMMVEFLHIRRCEKRNRTNFYRVMLQVRVSSI